MIKSSAHQVSLRDALGQSQAKFEALRLEHEELLTRSNPSERQKSEQTQDPAESDEKMSILSRSLEMVAGGLSEAAFISDLLGCVGALEAENTRLCCQINRLNETNAWVTEELKEALNKLQISEQKVVQLEEEKAHLSFMVEMLKSDDDENENNYEQPREKEATPPTSPVPGNPPKNEAQHHRDLQQQQLQQQQHQDHDRHPEPEQKANYVDPVLTDIDEDSLNESDCSSFGSSTGSNQTFSSQGSYNFSPENLSRLAALGSETSPEIRTLHNYVIKHVFENRADRAVLLCLETLERLDAEIGQENPYYASVLVILAMTYRILNNHESAAALLREALRIRESTLGPNHLAVVDVMNNLGLIYIEQGMYEEAEPLIRRALEIKQKHLGSRHPDVAKQLKNLALLFRHKRAYDKAAKYYKRAAIIYEKVYGLSDPVTVRTRKHLLSCYIRGKQESQKSQQLKEKRQQQHIEKVEVHQMRPELVC